MNISPQLICRAAGKVYEQIKVSELGDGHRLCPHYQYAEIGSHAPLPCRVIPVSQTSDTVEAVVVFPDLPEAPNPELCVAEIDSDQRVVASTMHQIDFAKAKWASRLNYKLKPEACTQIRSIDEYTPSYGDYELAVLNIIPDGDETILRGEVSWEHGKPDSMVILCLDHRLTVLNNAYIAMSITSSPYEADYHAMRQTVSFSIRIKRPQSDLILVSWNQDWASRSSYLHLNHEEQQRLNMPYAFYLYEDAGVSPHYSSWLASQAPSTHQLDIQRRASNSRLSALFSFVLDIRNGQDSGLTKATVDGLVGQSYPHWKLLILTDGQLDNTLLGLSERDRRIQLRAAGNKPFRIEDAASELSEANDAYLSVLTPGDIFAPDALYRIRGIVDESHPDAIYFDEDSHDRNGRYSHPVFKPDFNIDLLRSEDYLSHALFTKVSLLHDLGDASLDGNQHAAYDLAFRVAERAESIFHIPSVLLHRYVSMPSPSEGPQLPSNDEVVAAHLKRIGICAQVDSYRNHTRVLYGCPRDNPLVSIIIPNKDHVDVLDACVKSIIEKTSYDNYEIVIVENNSGDSNTFEYYQQLSAAFPEVISIAYWQGEFNFSKIINFGREHARGSFLLLLNNDTELITANWLEILLGLCAREEVGAVGVKLYYPDDTIQHAGVCLQEAAGHQFLHLPKNQKSYLSLADVQREVSCVTAACLMSRTDVFDLVGGFDPQIAIAYNDVNYCLTLRDKGYKIIYTPYVELYHYESVSRGLDFTPEQRARTIRALKEWSICSARWSDKIYGGDPFYSPNVRYGWPDCCYYLVKEA
ncbi:glycosyltransferase family 2 protein [Enorma phocaeensis]|uniref:glycosyltransferase family 2 protein n=1 Tax=Enorma phocaeensis TaxID=1871019 RepID=UPI003209E24B